METFEFLSILQSHGFSKVSILTLLDLVKESATLKTRFWTEIYQDTNSPSNNRLSFHLCNEILSTYLPKHSPIPPRRSNRGSHA